MLPSFFLFGKEISMYALMSVIGLLLAGFVFCRGIAKAGEDDNEAILFLLVLCGGILLGGTLLFGITNFARIPLLWNADSPRAFWEAFASIFGGMVFYGGLIGAFLFGSFYIRWRRLDRALYMDQAALFAPLFHAFARVGCFFGGCCYGIPSRIGFCAVGNTVTDIGKIRRFPVQLLESALNLILAAFIYSLLRRKRLKGRLCYLYLALYAGIRFFDELLRGDAVRGFLFGLSTSQWISIGIEFFACTMLLFPLFRNRQS